MRMLTRILKAAISEAIGEVMREKISNASDESVAPRFEAVEGKFDAIDAHLTKLDAQMRTTNESITKLIGMLDKHEAQLKSVNENIVYLASELGRLEGRVSGQNKQLFGRSKPAEGLAAFEITR